MIVRRRVAALFGCLCTVSLAQEAEKPKAAEPPKPAAPAQPSEAEAARWAKLAAPGEHHKRLQMLVGKWDVEITSPGGSPSKGTAEYKEMMGGRFVTEHVHCTLGDMPFQWFGIYGYDNVKKKYTAVWIDNLGTGTDYAEGNNEGDVIQLRGEAEEAPGQKMKYKWIIRIRDDKNVSIEMLEMGEGGKDTPQMTVLLKKAK